jgi:hypothetical protein
MRGNTLSRFWRVLLCAALLCFGTTLVQAQSSTPPSTEADPIWQSLLLTTQSLPGQFEDFTSSLTLQVQSLLDSNVSLQQTNTELQISNGQLADSNQSLQSKNADLTLSLQKSQARVATLESQSGRLQTDLQSSMQSTIQAQADAHALELQVTFLKIGCWSFGIIAVGEAAYITGHAFGWWK